MIYLDVRTPEEFALEHYPGAINHDVNLLVSGTFPNAILVPQDAHIKIYCRSGARAGAAQQILNKAGYMNTENAGGLSDLK